MAGSTRRGHPSVTIRHRNGEGKHLGIPRVGQTVQSSYYSVFAGRSRRQVQACIVAGSCPYPCPCCPMPVRSPFWLPSHMTDTRVRRKLRLIMQAQKLITVFPSPPHRGATSVRAKDDRDGVRESLPMLPANVAVDLPLTHSILEASAPA